MDERYVFDERSFAELVIWRLPRRLPGSAHQFKYRLAFVVDGTCVLRYDNESGKGDHRHVGAREATLRLHHGRSVASDFQRDILEWRDRDENGDV
jgi:hypothetical protein